MKKARLSSVYLREIQLNTGQLDWLPRNPRTWTQDDIDRTAASIKEDPDFLEDRPLLVVPFGKEFVAFAGNLRHEGAIAAGLEAVPCIQYVPETEEDYETIKRRAMKDNGSFGKWDWDTLGNEWDDQPLGDWGVPAWPQDSGFPPEENQPSAGGPSEAHEDNFDETKDEIHVICKPGDIWQLGDHRLKCGDSVDLYQVKELMGGGIS